VENNGSLLLTGTLIFLIHYFKVEMTPAGTLIVPKVTRREKKILDAKYEIFRESIEIQQRWRREIENALK
jgi:hypothetical protein